MEVERTSCLKRKVIFQKNKKQFHGSTSQTLYQSIPKLQTHMEGHCSKATLTHIHQSENQGVHKSC